VKDFAGRIAVVTGGASGVGRGLVEALLDAGTRVIAADVEKPALEATVRELSGRGEIGGVVTDVTRFESVDALAAHVFERFGACHLLFSNAGVAAGSGRFWLSTPRDWEWVHAVNVRGNAHVIQAFVPRMIASGEEGRVIITSSGDGGITPLPFAGVYAASNAARSAMAEMLANQLITEGTRLRASVFYPSGGMLRTRLNEAERNRPPELARERPRESPPLAWDELEKRWKAAGREIRFQDLYALGQKVLEGIREDRFVLGFDVEQMGQRLAERAQAIGRGELPRVALDLM
jgi:NAD(P)-dependent dehydrogenase (short-subunit alcohol dehydrogenase family)